MEVTIWLHDETLVNQQDVFTDTSSRISSMEVLIPLEVAVKVTCLLMRVLVCRLGNHYGYFQLILLEVAVKASWLILWLFHAGSGSEIKVTCLSTRVSACRSGNHCGYFHATYSAGNGHESDSFVNE